MIGVVTIQQALDQARGAGLDLIEVSPNADPPVCKVLDYGKYKFQEQKKQAAAKKKQKVIEVKEIKIRPGIEEHDYQVKLKAMRRFIEEEDKVKVTMRFRGREIAHLDIAMALMDRIKTDTVDIAKVEFAPKMEGRQMTMILGPGKPTVGPLKEDEETTSA
jgi:translation initiation factor IF-3